jgi:hypothetical protein
MRVNEMSERWCKFCKFEDKFFDALEMDYDEPYLCTRDATSNLGLDGCKTITEKERRRLSLVGCNFFEGRQ